MRVAVYFTPPADHPLVRAAAAWLGRDAFSGSALERGPAEGFGASELRDLTADPRRYGFHATLKPPFRIGDERSLDELRNFLAAFCRQRAATSIPALRLTEIGPFFALTADGGSAAVDALADHVVRAFDPFRAPPSDAEMARRRPVILTARQRKYLEDWGYPYVFADFRFHMTLTGPVPADRRVPMRTVLRERFASFIGRPLAVDGLALFCESAPPGDFVVDTYAPLAATDEPLDTT
jgi:putative phosphonate metabolism protein